MAIILEIRSDGLLVVVGREGVFVVADDVIEGDFVIVEVVGVDFVDDGCVEGRYDDGIVDLAVIGGDTALTFFAGRSSKRSSWPSESSEKSMTVLFVPLFSSSEVCFEDDDCIAFRSRASRASKSAAIPEGALLP